MGKINLQMYSFTDGNHEDWRENLKLAAELGFDGVELFGPCMDIPPEELKGILEENGIEAVSLHAPTSSEVIGLIPYAKAIGLKYMGIGMEIMMDDAAVHAFAGKLNEIGKECKENGITLTYHNHTQEFIKCDDTFVWDVLMKETDPEYVSFEMDAGWAAAAGFDPKEIVQKYSGRIRLIHVKESSQVIGPQPPMDFSKMEKDERGLLIFTPEQKEAFDFQKSINCPGGEGIVDWKALKEIADQHGVEHYVVEREFSPSGDRIADLKADIAVYRTMI